MNQRQNKESWQSRTGLVLAMAGNAVGLGNFLRFPAKAIENGGGSFIIPYLVCFLLIGLPMLFVEWSMGRFGGSRGDHSTPFILNSMGKWPLWKYIGVFGIFTNIAVAAYYCYIESWTLSYVYHSLAGTFQGQSAGQVQDFFNRNTQDPGWPNYFFWIICLALNTWILSRGLSGGVEKVAKIGMPLLILFGIFLAVQGLTLTAGSKGAVNDGLTGFEKLWTPDFSSIWQPGIWLAAAGQIFFTLSVGMGSIQCYASYMKPDDDIALNAMSAGWMNGFVEVVLGGAIVIPIAVGYLGIEGVMDLAGSKWGLGFQTMPYLFQQWGAWLGVFAGCAWFGLLFFAGITSSLAMGTPCMGFLQDEFGWRRSRAALAFGLAVFALGAPTVIWYEYGVFDEFDYWAGDVSLVVFALLETILFAWVFGMKKGWAEITRGADIRVHPAFRFIIQYVTPLMLLIILLGSIGSWVDKIGNSAIKAQIAGATDPKTIVFLEETLLFTNISRIGLLCLFAGIAFMVYVAHRKRLGQPDRSGT